MEFFEKDLEEIIYLSDKENLSDRGLDLTGKLKRQLRIGNYGIADLVEFKRPYYHPYYKTMMKGEINIIELKNKKIGVSTFFQALNYLKGIRTYLGKKDIENNYNYRITLVGRELDLNSSFCFLGYLFDNDLCDSPIYSETKTSINLFTYNYNIDGIEFNSIYNYDLTNKGF